MSYLFTLQSNFNGGQLTPKAHARVGRDFYFKSCKTMQNVLTTPQGGFKRRFGLKYQFEVSGITDYTQCRIGSFQYSDEGKTYVLVFKNLTLDIYLNGSLVAGSIVTPYTTSDLPNIMWAQTEENVIVVHRSYNPRLLVRTSADSGWTFNNVTFKFFPTFDYRDDYNSVTFTLSATTGDNVTLTASGGSPFVSDHVGGVFLGGDTGALRIKTFVSSTQVRGDIVVDFDQTTISGELAFLAEPAFGNTRGWPDVCGFFESRLVLARQDKIWMSTTDNFVDFNDLTTNDTDSITLNLKDQLSRNGGSIRVKRVLGTFSLLIFTQNSIETTPLFSNTELVPTNATANIQNNHGVSNVDPVFVDNNVIYIDAGGRIVHSLVYNDNTASFEVEDISILAEDLIKNPVDMGYLKHQSTDDSQYVFIINNDGTIASFQEIDDENIADFTELTTTSGSGKFRWITAVENDVWFLVERTIDGSAKFYVEKLDFSAYMDSEKTQTFGSPTTVITGLSHLEGETVQVIGDDNVQPTKTVSSGQITIDTAATTVSVGLKFIPKVEQLDASFNQQNGPDLYFPKRLLCAYIDTYKSLNVYFNGKLLDNLNLDLSTYDNSDVELTKIYKEPVVNGWNDGTRVVITQDEPSPMEIRAIGRLIETTDIGG